MLLFSEDAIPARVNYALSWKIDDSEQKKA